MDVILEEGIRKGCVGENGGTAACVLLLGFIEDPRGHGTEKFVPSPCGKSLVGFEPSYWENLGLGDGFDCSLPFVRQFGELWHVDMKKQDTFVGSTFNYPGSPPSFISMMGYNVCQFFEASIGMIML